MTHEIANGSKLFQMKKKDYPVIWHVEFLLIFYKTLYLCVCVSYL